MIRKVYRYTFLLIVLLLVVGCNKNISGGGSKELEKYYLASESNKVVLLDENYEKEKEVIRGEVVELIKKDEEYYKVKYDGEEYYINKKNLSKDEENIILEKELFVRTSLNFYKDKDTSSLIGLIKKGNKVEIIGYDKLNEDGSVNKYKINYNNTEGYVRAKYLVKTLEEAKKKYDYNDSLKVHEKMGSSLGGGNALELDYYPYEKGNFKDNVMPKETRTLYINASAIANVDKYIEFAKKNNINAFVVDIKDNTQPAYPANAMKKYSPTNYNKAINTYGDYKKYIQKLKNNGFYVIGRITVFKDSYFINDHSEVAIKDNSTKKPFSHNGSYWPSAFNRLVWEFNVELAKESAKEIGFNEIQFDYVRFPDQTMWLETNKKIDMVNTYNESKAQALQTFVMYATDELHEINTYISIDVFGESVHDYVTAYGQYWPALSNIVDVISGMPYPDHFNPYQYGFKEVVWTTPYKLLEYWGSLVKEKQKIIPTPAKVRTWIQVYDVFKTPSVKYDSIKVSDQIDGLYANELKDGYMTWNSNSSLLKYNEVSEAFKKERVYE